MNRNYNRFKKSNRNNNNNNNKSNNNNDSSNSNYNSSNSNQRYQKRNTGSQQQWRKPRNSKRFWSKSNDRSRQNDRQNSNDRWFKITVQNSADLEPFYVLNSLSRLGNLNFIPFNYSINGSSVSFYVQGEELCSSIKSFNRRISTPDGHKLIIQSDKVPSLNVNIDSQFIEKLKIVMSKRYNAETKSLNLSKLYEEENFLNDRLYVSLQRINVCREVVKILVDNIPDLISIDLSNNKMNCLDPFKPIVDSCKNLKKLNLSSNNLLEMSSIDVLKGLTIDEINLDDNPFKRNLKDKSQEFYTAFIRKRFPQVMNIDGISIPPPICFDVGDTTTLPEVKDSFIPENLRIFVSDFVKQYFTCFDSDNRQSLLDAYHDHALFSYSLNRTNDFKSNKKTFESNLMGDNRNLLKIKETLSSKTLKQGKVNVVSTLTSMPKTEHVLQSFKIDVPLFSEKFVTLIITGLFKTTNPSTLRAFVRNFLIVPHNSGFAITNDILLLTNPTVDNINFYKNYCKSDPSGGDVNSMEMTTDSMISQLNNNIPVASSSDPNQELILKFCQITGMNEVYSKQCLIENYYDADKALENFKRLNEQKSIPPEAFNHLN